MRHFLHIWILLLAVTTGCDPGGGGVIIPTQLPGLQVRLDTVDESGDLLELPELGIAITSASSTVTDIVATLPKRISCQEYRAFSSKAGGTSASCAKKQSSRELHFESRREFNLLTGAASPPITDLVMPAGEYSNLQLRLQMNGESTENVRLSGYLLTDVTLEYEILLFSDQLTSISLSSATSPIALDINNTDDILIKIDPDSWLAPVAALIGDCFLAASVVSGVNDCGDLSSVLAQSVTSSAQLTQTTSTRR